MKKKGLSLILAVLVIVASAAVLTCGCASGDYAAAGMASSGKTPQCHSMAKASEPRRNPRKECCGKCGAEWAELSLKELAGSVIHRVTKAIPVFSGVDRSLKFPKTLFFHGRAFQSPPVDFFTGHVLITTFTFRGPPAG
jgi:hypothetical protein